MRATRDTRNLSKSRVRLLLQPISARYITRGLHIGLRSEASLSCPLFAFEFGFRSEPEFVASTVRPARIVSQLMRAFADPLFISIHVMASSLNREAMSLSPHYVDVARPPIACVLPCCGTTPPTGLGPLLGVG